MSRQLPVAASLEYLKKEAKEHLREGRFRNPGWRLADAQHSLAHAYGFESWAKLKAHVKAFESSPLAGRWIADVANSSRHPANRFRRATIDVSVAGRAITFAHDAIDEFGRDDCGVNTLEVDGIERTHAHGYRMTVRWADPRTLEIMTTHAGRPAKGATYAVSPDGGTLIVSTIDQRLVFVRG